MQIEPRPIRSLLFVPGNREDWMRKALQYEADALVFDLESAIPRGQAEAEAARGMCRRVIESHEAARPLLFVRVCDVRSPHMPRDLEAVVHRNLHAVMLPQIAGAEDVRILHAELERHERAAQVPVGQTVIMPLVETANAARTGYEVASASPRVAYMGGAASRGGDIARSLGYRWTPEGRETLFLRSKLLMDVRSAGIFNPITGLWGRIEDTEGLRAFTEQSRDLGYEGMMAIYPSHLPVINAAFSPSEQEIAEWQRVVAAMEEADREGRGAIRLGGQLIDWAHVETARRDLARAHDLGLI